jgi:hypothetical protein
MQEPQDIQTFVGFDESGDPVLQKWEDSTLSLSFSMMPPSWFAPDNESWADFDTQLQAAIQAEVQWEDREFFLISNAQADTPAQIEAFLRNFRARHHPSHSRACP